MRQRVGEDVQTPCDYCQLKALEREYPGRTLTLIAVQHSVLEGHIAAVLDDGQHLGYFASIPLRCVCGASPEP